jgi:hypothetical protein
MKPECCDEVGDSLDCLPQHIVGDEKGVVERSMVRSTAWRSSSLGMVIRVSTTERSYLETGLCLTHAVSPLEWKGLGDDGDGQRIELSSKRGNDRGCAGPGSTPSPTAFPTTKTSRPLRGASMIFSVSSSAASRPVDRIGNRAKPPWSAFAPN